MDNLMIEAALEYIAQGLKVFPVRANKKPLTKHGLKDATQSEVVIRKYWEKWLNAGIGLVTEYPKERRCICLRISNSGAV